jgi:hypothetical protein
MIHRCDDPPIRRVLRMHQVIMTATPKPLPQRLMIVVHSWLTWAATPAFFERSAIGSIENMIDFTMNTKKHGVDREKDQQRAPKINFTLRS